MARLQKLNKKLPKKNTEKKLRSNGIVSFQIYLKLTKSKFYQFRPYSF